MGQSDLSELAALNRQIAERDQIIRALLSCFDSQWVELHTLSSGICRLCMSKVIVRHIPKIRTIHHCDHLPTCPYRRALELTADSPPTPD